MREGGSEGRWEGGREGGKVGGQKEEGRKKCEERRKGAKVRKEGER